MDDEYDREAVSQLYARCHSHEFLIEVIFAQLLAQSPAETNRAFCNDLLRNTKNLTVPAAADDRFTPEALFQLASDARAITERFVERALKHADLIRARWAKEDSDRAARPVR